RSSRQARAMEKNSKYGRKEQEGAWQNAEVDALHRMAAAGVSVPQIFNFVGGVLLMELVVDADGKNAPRLNDVKLTDSYTATSQSTMYSSAATGWSLSTCPKPWMPRGITTQPACWCGTWRT